MVRHVVVEHKEILDLDIRQPTLTEIFEKIIQENSTKVVNEDEDYDQLKDAVKQAMDNEYIKIASYGYNSEQEDQQDHDSIDDSKDNKYVAFRNGTRGSVTLRSMNFMYNDSKYYLDLFDDGDDVNNDGLDIDGKSGDTDVVQNYQKTGGEWAVYPVAHIELVENKQRLNLLDLLTVDI